MEDEDDWDGVKHHTKIFDPFSIMKDKAVNEWGLVNTLLAELAIDSSSLRSVSLGNDPPDCTLEFSGKLVGIEVVGLMDQRARELTARARWKSEACTEQLNWETRAVLAVHDAIWTRDTFHAAARELALTKDEKVRAGIRDKKAASECDKFWLVIHSDEMYLNSRTVSEFANGFKLNSGVFERIYLVLSYEPDGNEGRYPYFQLK